MGDFWQSGDQILWRYGEYVVHPMTVVEDNADRLVAWMPMGTPILDLERADGRKVRADPATMFTAPRRSRPGVWWGSGILRVLEPGRRWSTWLFFDGETGAFRGWYCNIEEVHRRSGRTTWSRDEVLDVWVEPDRTWERKDEDEVVLGVEQGRFTPAEADELYAIAEEIEDVIRAWGSPFRDGGRPSGRTPAWPVPALPSPG